MARFHTLSLFFSIDGTGLYVGQAIASEEAIYLAAGLEPFNLTSLFTGRLGKALSGKTGALQTPLANLPDSVTRDSTWPIRTPQGFAVVMMRESISKISCSIMGKLRVSNDQHSAVIYSGMLKRFALLRSLRQLGWSV